MASPMACSVATLLVAFLSLSWLPLETTAWDGRPPWPSRFLRLHSPPPPVPSWPHKHVVPPSRPTTSSGLGSATSTLPPLEEPDDFKIPPWAPMRRPLPPTAPVRRPPPPSQQHPPPPPPPLPQLHPPPPPPPVEEPDKFTKVRAMGPVRGRPPIHTLPLVPPIVGQYKIKRPRPWPALQPLARISGRPPLPHRY